VNRYPFRLLVAWVTILALAWLAFSSPLSAKWNWLLGVLTIGLALLMTASATRRLRAQRHAVEPVLQAIQASLDQLPGDLRRNTPLILTVGVSTDALAKAFGHTLIRITDAALWVRVDDPVRLAHVATGLKDWRAGQGPDAVAWLIGADGFRDAGTLMQEVGRWRSAIDEASRAVGYVLPVCLAVYAEDSDDADVPTDGLPWFGVSGMPLPAGNDLPASVANLAFSYSMRAAPADRARHMRRAARIDAMARWTADTLLSAVSGSARDGIRHGRPVLLEAIGLTVVAGASAADSMLARFVAQQTALVEVVKPHSMATYPLPAPLLLGIASQPARRALPRALAHAWAWLMLAFCLACAASAWQNRALVARVMTHIARYEAIGPEHDTARVDALQALKRDRDELDQYARAGVPPRLGLGFYRGTPLLASLNALIAGYQPPPPPPVTIELDSLSLFRSGSATLDSGSNRLLIRALDLIKAHPDKRVLVAGHTDSTGSPQANLKLSEARAASVRNWLADAAALPLTRFAIQGYGDTRPKATNDTDAGRAANRRVEITLVADCRDVRDGDQATPGHPACSFQ